MGPDRLRKLSRRRGPKLYREDEELEDLEAEPQPDCVALGCLVALGGEADPFNKTPAPTDPPFLVSNSGGNDPQVAAGKSHLIVTSYNRLWVYTKDGKLATKDKYGNPLSYPIKASELFKPLWDPPGPNSNGINGFLKLPSGVPCDVEDPFATGTFCLNDWYDMRVIYDDFRDRFWVVASARNPNWKKESATLKQRIARRSKVALAVSRTSDPRDGFYLYWWNAVIDDGACATLGSAPGPPPACPNSTYQPGDAADYPSLGISKDFFTQTIGVVNVNPHDPDWPESAGKYALVNVFDADKLASGGCSQPCSWSYWNFKYPGTETIVKGIVQPAVQHGAVQNDFATMASTEGDHNLWVWGFTKQEGAFAPPLHGAAISVKKWVGPTNPNQPPKGAVTSPAPISYGNLGNLVTKAVTRTGLMYATCKDCSIWFSGQAPCSTSIGSSRSTRASRSPSTCRPGRSSIELRLPHPRRGRPRGDRIRQSGAGGEQGLGRRRRLQPGGRRGHLARGQLQRLLFGSRTSARARSSRRERLRSAATRATPRSRSATRTPVAPRSIRSETRRYGSHTSIRTRAAASGWP